MAFRFRLDTVLRHRNRLMEERSRDVAAAEARLNQLDGRVQDIERELAKAYTEEQLPDGTPFHLGDMMAKRKWLEYLGNQRDQTTRLRDQAQVARDESRHRLEEAWQQREVLDRLRRRRLSEHRARLGRAETLVMDEIASVRHALVQSADSSGLAAFLAGATGAKASGDR